jgi:hypothetical protein
MILDTTIRELPVIGVKLNGYWYHKTEKINELRDEEMVSFESISTDGLVSTLVIFDQYNLSVQSALYSIYTTIFIVGLLIVSVLI